MESPVSAEHPTLRHLADWLDVDEVRVASGRPAYRHLLVKRTTSPLSEEAKDELYSYIDHAHEGARRSLREALGTSLHPVSYGTPIDPAYGYPHRFPMSALRGFFGELMSGIVAEYWLGHDGIVWEVPVYLFRYHIVAFQQLELMKQTDDWDRQMLGRTGDDGLGFHWDEDDERILGWLACEAKCTSTHSATMIKDNHKKLSTGAKRPVDLLRLIPALQDYDRDRYRDVWIDGIRQFYFDLEDESQRRRRDLSVYVCAQCPQRGDTWTDKNRPHAKYSGGRDLYCVEIQMADVDSLIAEMYGRMEPAK